VVIENIKYKIIKNVSLKSMNTLRMNVFSKFFVFITSIEELREVIADRKNFDNILILGGGSNIFFSKYFDGLIIKMGIQGKKIVYEDENFVHLEVSAGEDWSSLVEFTVSQGWGGIENLAMVPGTAGAAPVQNIACYGHNLHESLLSVDAIDISTSAFRRFLVDDCRLGYRTSIFKEELKGKYIIISILLKLTKHPVLNISYKSRYESVEDELSKVANQPYTVRDVYQAIVNIRKKKLPDISDVGTVGSVFKNPLITQQQLNNIRNMCPDIQCYPSSQLSYVDNNEIMCHEMVKVPAAWLIDDMGWAGKRHGDCGVWKSQPLNIVNYGSASPEEYIDFINMVKDEIYNKYSIDLETEIIVV